MLTLTNNEFFYYVKSLLQRVLQLNSIISEYFFEEIITVLRHQIVFYYR